MKSPMLCRPPEADLQRAAIFMRRAAGSSPPVIREGEAVAKPKS